MPEKLISRHHAPEMKRAVDYAEERPPCGIVSRRPEIDLLMRIVRNIEESSSLQIRIDEPDILAVDAKPFMLPLSNVIGAESDQVPIWWNRLQQRLPGQRG
jgi:hypothetical protein